MNSIFYLKFLLCVFNQTLSLYEVRFFFFIHIFKLIFRSYSGPIFPFPTIGPTAKSTKWNKIFETHTTIFLPISNTHSSIGPKKIDVEDLISPMHCPKKIFSGSPRLLLTGQKFSNDTACLFVCRGLLLFFSRGHMDPIK